MFNIQSQLILKVKLQWSMFKVKVPVGEKGRNCGLTPAERRAFR